MTTAAQSDDAFLAGIRRAADEAAAPHADDVDRNARFPTETFAALREDRALSALVPTEFGGGGVAFETVASACFELGRRCGASAMVFAMHQIKVASIIRHLENAGWYEDYLRTLCAEQRLVASITSEVGTGGDMGRSIAAVVTTEDGRRAFEKHATTVSYAHDADDFFTTVRSGPDAKANDQVLVLTTRDQTRLEPAGSWDPLGMRGTCSPGFVVSTEFEAEQVLPTPFSRVAGESMVPASHILWSHVWLGIATDAFDRARAFVRAQASRTPGETPPSAARLSNVMSQLTPLRAEVALALREFVEWSEEPGRGRLGTMASALRFNNLKIAASDQAPRICQAAMQVCGIAGYRNDTPFSVGRHVRDTLSAPLMVANERIHQTDAGLLLVAKEV